MSRSLAILAAAVVLACSREADEDGKRRLFSREEDRPAAARLDPARPQDSLALPADEVARRLGSFEWTAGVDWTVSRSGDDGTRVHAAERHGLRQAASGEFELDSEVDPGLGAGSETGKRIIWTGGMTYGAALHAPMRERPTDGGRDARRFRDDSFETARHLAALFGERLQLTPSGDTTHLGRAAKRFKFSLAPQGTAAPAKPVPATEARDEDTARRLTFLEARVPLSAEGELVADAESGAPLRVRLAGVFSVAGAPDVRANVEVVAQVKAIGDRVAAIAPPKDPLPDVRKPPGVAGALEAAGLKKRGEAEADAPRRVEPEDDGD
jgi:hypothetical protein